MANYVYNRIICNEEIKDELKDKLKIDFFSYNSPIVESQTSENRYEIKCATCGMEYYDEEIRTIIDLYPDTEVFCIEENFIEEGHYYKKNGETILEIRKFLNLSDTNIEYISSDIDLDYVNYVLTIDLGVDEKYSKFDEVSTFTNAKVYINDVNENKDKIYPISDKQIRKILKEISKIKNIKTVDGNESTFFVCEPRKIRETSTFTTSIIGCIGDNIEIFVNKDDFDLPAHSYYRLIETDSLNLIFAKINEILQECEIDDKYMMKLI